MSGEAKRFDVYANLDAELEVKQNPDGHYVLASAYDLKVAECERLRRALEKISAQCGDTGFVNNSWVGTVARKALHPPAEKGQPIDRARFEQAPCYLCGYNGHGYFQPDRHKCAALYHAEKGTDNE